MQLVISQGKNEKIDEFINEGNFEDALKLSTALLEKEPDNPILNFKVGYCYLNTTIQKSQSTSYLQKSVEVFKQTNSQNTLAIEALFYLGKSYHKNNNFEKAIEVFQMLREEISNKEMLDAIEEEIQQCNFGRQYKQRPVNIQITNIGNIINSKYSDHSPILSADESVLIFTSRRKRFEAEKPKSDGQFNEDIYFSNFDGEKWLKPKSISNNINTDAHEAAIGLSPDGQQLLIYRDMDAGTILISNLIGDTWTTPFSLGDNINSKYRETHATISADNKHLYFTSDRPGGFGGLDIYHSEKQPDGSWGKAINLGSSVNTAKDEEGPFIHPDGITLYFSSKGHQTMGGFDIFFSQKNESGEWTEPENMGYPVNTTEDEAFFTTTPDGKRSYFASYREGGIGNTDIYMMGMPEAEEKPVTVVKGVVAACKSEIQNVQISVFDSLTNELIGLYKPNSSTGKYLYILTRGKKYQVIFQIGGKNVYKEDFEISKDADYQVIYRSIKLKSEIPCDDYIGLEKDEIIVSAKEDNVIIENENSIVIENIVFKINDAEITYFKENILKLSNYLKNNPDVKVDIVGYTDTQGPEAYNLKLSNKRAATVYNSLIKQGVNPDQLTYRGNGEKNQLTINNYKDGSYVWGSLPYNRRVEFIIRADSSSKLVVKQVNVPKVYLSNQSESDMSNFAEYKNKFTIQLGAYSKPVGVEHFKKLNNIQMFYGGKYYHYTYGEFKDEDEASVEIKEVYRLGYNDAFIRRISFYFPDKINK